MNPPHEKRVFLHSHGVSFAFIDTTCTFRSDRVSVSVSSCLALFPPFFFVWAPALENQSHMVGETGCLFYMPKTHCLKNGLNLRNTAVTPLSLGKTTTTSKSFRRTEYGHVFLSDVNSPSLRIAKIQISKHKTSLVSLQTCQ